MMRGKKILLSAVLFSTVVLLSGCETAAGATKGIACGIGSTAEGAVKDGCSFFGAMMKLDNWIQENLW
jgi:predicted small secreted protein